MRILVIIMLVIPHRRYYWVGSPPKILAIASNGLVGPGAQVAGSQCCNSYARRLKAEISVEGKMVVPQNRVPSWHPR